MPDKMEGVNGSAQPMDPSKYPIPIETIWIGNLAEHLKIDELKEDLKVAFKDYVPIIDIIAKRSLKRKGQAFIVFASEQTARQAAAEMDGFVMCGKPMKVQMAKTHSDATVKAKAGGMLEEHKRKRLTQKDLKRAREDADAAANPTAVPEKPRHLRTGVNAIPDEFVRPNRTLFLQGLPSDVDEDALTTIFEQFDGFKNARHADIMNVAWVEFENEPYAIAAKEAVTTMTVGQAKQTLQVTYKRDLEKEEELRKINEEKRKLEAHNRGYQEAYVRNWERGYDRGYNAGRDGYYQRRPRDDPWVNRSRPPPHPAHPNAPWIRNYGDQQQAGSSGQSAFGSQNGGPQPRSNNNYRPPGWKPNNAPTVNPLSLFMFR